MKRYGALAAEMERAADLAERDFDRKVTSFDARDWAEKVRSLAVDRDGAVSLSRDEWNRVLGLLHRPTPPGPFKDLDEAIINKINRARGQ